MLADPRLTASVLPTTSASRLRPELAPPRPRPEAPAAGAALPPPPPPRPHAPKLTLLLSSSSSSSSSAASFCASCSDRASKSLRSAASFFAAAVISAMRPESNCPLPVSIVGMSGARTMRASLRFLVVMRRMSGESRASSLSSSLPMTSARSTATPMGSLSDGEATLPSASSFSGSRSNATCDAARDSTRDDALELASPPRAPMPPAAPSPLRSSNTSNLTWARGPAAGGSLSRALVSLPATTAAALPDAEWAGLASGTGADAPQPMAPHCGMPCKDAPPRRRGALCGRPAARSRRSRLPYVPPLVVAGKSNAIQTCWPRHNW
mmetsp:Transcript_28567/g.84559  ORF Transcript_28567/g.84559 Transcript_28567/m.84559 type:complete len:323 (-) Transcript_28567:117-1085(-)